jgi:hypothetical protein
MSSMSSTQSSELATEAFISRILNHEHGTIIQDHDCHSGRHGHLYYVVDGL